MSSQEKFNQLIAGELQPLTESEMLQFKEYCSQLIIPLDKWVDIALTFYKKDPQLCWQILLYVEKDQIHRHNYRDFKFQNAKIAIYNNLAALHLGRAVREQHKQDSDKYMEKAVKYMNQSEKVKNMAGMVYLTLRGFLLFYEGNFDQSIGNFNKSVDKNTEEEGQSVVGVIGLAQLAFAKKNYELSLSHYKRALRMNKSLPTKARLGMAYCFYELEKYELAKACFKRILNLEPNCVEAMIGYGTMWFHEDYPDKYFELLEQCYRLNPNHPLVLLHLSEHMLMSKNVGKLPSVCEKGLQSLKSFPAFVDKNDQYRNDKIEYKCRFNHILGQLYHQQNEHQTCIRHYNLALNNHLLFVHINLAQAYTNPSIPMYQDAVKLLDTVQRNIQTKHKRLLSETYRLQGYIKSKLYKQQANDLYNEAIKYNPNDFESLIEYCNMLQDNDFKKCLSLYQSAEQVLINRGEAPQPQLYNNLAVMSIATQDYTLAEKYMNLAFLQVDVWRGSNHEEENVKEVKEKGLLAIFHFNRAIIYEETFRFEKCQSEYAKVLQINPYVIDVYVRQSLLAFKLGNMKQALQICEDGHKVIAQCKFIGKEVHSIDMVKAYIFKSLNDERSARQALSRHRNHDSYAKVFDDSLEFDILIQKTDSNTLNLRNIFKQKAVSVLGVCEIEKYNVYEFMILATLLAEIGKGVEALQCFNNIKQFDEQHPQIMYNLSILYYKLERYDDAIMTLKRYIEKTSRLETLKAELSLAIILFVQGKSYEAVKAIKKLILIHPSNIMLRYNLNLFLQRSSQVTLDGKIKQTKKTQASIAYLKRCYAFFNHLSRLNINEHLNCIENHEAKDKMRLELSHIVQRSEDQKLYIKSRQERFTAYERQAEIKEHASTEEYKKIVSNMRERMEMRKRMEQQEEFRKQREAEEKRRARMLQQKQIEEQLNMKLQQQLQQRQPRDGKRTPRAKKARKNRNIMDDEDELQAGRQTVQDSEIMPVQETQNKQRYNRLVHHQQSSEQLYDTKNRIQSNAGQQQPEQPMNQQHKTTHPVEIPIKAEEQVKPLSDQDDL